MERSGQDALCKMEMGTYIRCACESQRFRQIVSGSSLLDRENTGVVCQDAYHACFLHLKKMENGGKRNENEENVSRFGSHQHAGKHGHFCSSVG